MSELTTLVFKNEKALLLDYYFTGSMAKNNPCVIFCEDGYFYDVHSYTIFFQGEPEELRDGVTQIAMEVTLTAEGRRFGGTNSATPAHIP